MSRGARPVTAALPGAGVLTHWVLDVIAHRPDMPVYLDGSFVGLGLWNSVGATLLVERFSCWLLIASMLVAYFAAAFGPPPPDVTTLAWSALAMWLLVAWGWFADRSQRPTRQLPQ